MIGPEIVVPLVVLAVGLLAAWWWFRRWVRQVTSRPSSDDRTRAAAARLTSAALHRALPVGWRAVHEVGPDLLGGADHVVIGPAGVFALCSSLEPLDAEAAAERAADRTTSGAIVRGAVDDVIGHLGLSTVALVDVAWGRDPSSTAAPDDEAPAAEPPVAFEVGHRVVRTSGHRLDRWLTTPTPSGGAPLPSATVEAAWRAVLVAIGRPDPGVG